MVEGSFRNNQRVRRVGQEGAHHALHGHKVRGEPGRGLCISVEPFLELFDLVREVNGGGTERRRIEGGLLQSYWTLTSSQYRVPLGIMMYQPVVRTYTTLTSFPTWGSGICD